MRKCVTLIAFLSLSAATNGAVSASPSYRTVETSAKAGSVATPLASRCKAACVAKYSAKASDIATELFSLGVKKYNLEMTLRARAGLTECNRSELANYVSRATVKVNDAILRDEAAPAAFLLPDEEAESEISSRGFSMMVLRSFESLEVGYLLGYSSFLRAELESRKRESVEGRLMCDTYSRLAESVLANAKGLGDSN